MAKRKLPPITGAGNIVSGRAGVSGVGAVSWTRLTRWHIEKHLRKRIEAGDGAALLDAVDFCARAGTPMPPWLAEAYCSRYADWRMFGKRTLDDAFTVAAARKGKRIRNLEHREWLKPRVVLAAMRLHEEKGLSYDETLFDRVGKKFKIGRSTATELFYAEDNPWRTVIEALKKTNSELLKTKPEN